MRLAEDSLPKTNAATGVIYGEDEPCFCDARETIGEILPRCAGKILLSCSGGGLPAVMPFAAHSRTVLVVDESDALPLFSMPDGVGAVIAVGGTEILASARFFAKIRKIPCYLFPTEASLFGACAAVEKVRIGGSVSSMPVAAGELFFDDSLLDDSLLNGYGEILLSRLAAFEERALAGLFRRSPHGSVPSAEELTEALPQSLAGVLRCNRALRGLEGAGLPLGEGRALAEAHRAAGESLPFWRAFKELTAVYAAFFECGVPRRYFVPDYSARTQAAGEFSYAVKVPAWREYADRAFALERIRGNMAARMGAIRASLLRDRTTISRLTGELPAGGLTQVKILPERCPNGLCAVIRDFGLLE